MLNNVHDLLLVSNKESEKEMNHEVLEYIETDGTQCFLTDWFPNYRTSKVEYSVEFGSIPSDTSFAFGCRNEASSAYPSYGTTFVKDGNVMKLRIDILRTASTESSNVWSTVAANTDYLYTYYNWTVYENSTLLQRSPAPTGDKVNQLCLAPYCMGSTSLKHSVDPSTDTSIIAIGDYFVKKSGSPQRIKNLKCWDLDNGSYVLVRDYIPVLDNQLQPCLYDRITKTFIYPIQLSGSNAVGYKRWNKYDVDYIESDGNQYVDTGLSGFTRFTGTAECTDLSSKSQVLIGDGSSGGHFLASRISTTEKWGTITSSVAGYTSVDTLSKVDFDVSFASGKTFGTVNNESFTFSRTGTFSDFSIFINATGNSYPFYGNLYELKAYQGDNLDKLVRDFHPSVWHNSGTTAIACLYDSVYNKMYTNAGTGRFKAYIAPETKYNLMNDNINTNGYSIDDSGSVTVQAQSDYTDAIPVKEGDIVTVTFTSSSTTGQKRLHGYTGTSIYNWNMLLGKVDYRTTGDQTRSLTVTIPSGITYIRVSHSIIGETECTLIRTRTYVVGKAITTNSGGGYDLSVPSSNNFIFDTITTCKTASSNYYMDTRKVITGSSATYQNNTGAFGIGGSSSGATVNWKDGTGDNQNVQTNGTNWNRAVALPFKYRATLTGWDEGTSHKRTASFYHFGSDRNSDRVVTNGVDITENNANITLLYTTNTSTILSGGDIGYVYFAQNGVVEYNIIPVRNATNASDYMLFNRVTKTSLPMVSISGSPSRAFVILD